MRSTQTVPAERNASAISGSLPVEDNPRGSFGPVTDSIGVSGSSVGSALNRLLEAFFGSYSTLTRVFCESSLLGGPTLAEFNGTSDFLPFAPPASALDFCFSSVRC